MSRIPFMFHDKHVTGERNVTLLLCHYKPASFRCCFFSQLHLLQHILSIWLHTLFDYYLAPTQCLLLSIPTLSLRIHHSPRTEFTQTKTALFKNAHTRIFQYSETPPLSIQGFSHSVGRISLNSLERFMLHFIEKGNQCIPFVDGVTE